MDTMDTMLKTLIVNRESQVSATIAADRSVASAAVEMLA